MTTVAIILLLLIVFLAIPLRFIFTVSRSGTLQGRLTLQWLFGLLSINLSSPQQADEVDIPAAEANKKGPSRFNLTAALRQKPFRDRLIQFVRDIWHAIKREKFTLYIRLGLGDPADTGQLWAIIGPLSGILIAAEEADITIEPDFIEATFELRSHGNIRIIPLQITYLIIGLLLSPAIWRGLKHARRANSAANKSVFG